MERVFNFSAGPSMLPLEVLEQAQKEFVCYGSSGMSVMEMSHRSKVFEGILEKAQADLRDLMHIPDNYKILFLQGGGSTQFAMIPLNLMNKNNKADYVVTGQWAKKAAEEAARYGKVNIVASSADTTFDRIPELDESKFDKHADYFYITLNNTIYGTRWTKLPNVGDVPLVGDMSSSGKTCWAMPWISHPPCSSMTSMPKTIPFTTHRPLTAFTSWAVYSNG